MTTPTDPAAAGANNGAGAGNSQTSEAEVTKLRADLESSIALVATKDTELDTANKAVSDLQGANKKFADDAAGLANQGTQLKETQSQLEESRKTSTDLTTKLEESTTAFSGLQGQVTTRRRQDLVSKYGLPEEHVAGLDEAGLTILESTLPLATPAKPANGNTPAPGGTGLGLDGGVNTVDPNSLSDSQRALSLVERLKTK